MLAMWHQVSSRGVLVRPSACMSQQSAARTFAHGAKNAASHFVITGVVDWLDAQKKGEVKFSSLGRSTPPADICWIEYALTGSTVQVGVVLMRIQETDDAWWMGVAVSNNCEPTFLGDAVVHFDGDGICRTSQINNGDQMAAIASSQVHALQAFAFLHCRNVRQHDVSEKHGPSSKWCRRNRVPSITYKTLLIPGFVYEGRIVEEDGSLGDWVVPGYERRLHMVRGHFATYTEDRPRFGSHAHGVGKFWIRPHIRGNEKNGVVVKDYEIAPPELVGV